MKYLFKAFCALAVCLSVRAETVPAILSRMDGAAPKFTGMAANVHMTTYRAIINDKDEESGTLKMQRWKNGQLIAILDFLNEPKDARVIAIGGNKARIYTKASKTYQDFDIGKGGDALNQFFLLGFGSSGKALAESYDITATGAENIAGQETTKLLLVPKTADVKKSLAKVEMWVGSDASYPVQQQFYQPNGNYWIVTYSAITLNPPTKGKLEFKLPSGATKLQ